MGFSPGGKDWFGDNWWLSLGRMGEVWKPLRTTTSLGEKTPKLTHLQLRLFSQGEMQDYFYATMGQTLKYTCSRASWWSFFIFLINLGGQDRILFKEGLAASWGVISAAVWVPKATPFPAAAAKSFRLCPTLCDPIDRSPPGSPIPGILQARTLEWVAISFPNAWKWKGGF